MRNAPPQFFLTLYGWTFWVPVAITGTLATVILALIGFTSVPWSWPILIVAAIFAVLTVATLAFYRDFPRPIPNGPHVMVAPADGKVSEITHLEHYAPFNGPALKVGIFLSVLDVHVNRSPCDATVLWTRYEEGLFLDARHPDCSAKNQSHTLCLADPSSKQPIAIVKQIVGAIARRIIAPVVPGDVLSRGERFGMIAFGSRTELYVSTAGVHPWRVAVPLDSHVKGGQDILLRRN